MLKFIRYTLIATGPLLLLLAACGGDDDDGGGDEGGGTTATATGDEPTPSEAEPAETEDGDNGGDASPELTAYFEAMSDLAFRTDTRLEEIGNEVDSGVYATDQEEIEANAAALQESGETVEAALLEMSDLDVPSEVETEHSDFFDSLNAVLQIFASLSIEIEDVTTVAELDAMFDTYSADLSSADADFDDTCLALQAVADNAGISADMRCTD